MSLWPRRASGRRSCSRYGLRGDEGHAGVVPVRHIVLDGKLRFTSRIDGHVVSLGLDGDFDPHPGIEWAVLAVIAPCFAVKHRF